MKRGCRMQHRKNEEVLHLKMLPPYLGDSDLLAQKSLGGKVTQGADHAGFNEFDLFPEMGHAGLNLDGFRISIFRRPAFQDVRDVDILASQPDRGEEFAQQLPGLTDEGPALPILVETRRLSDKQDSGVGVPFAEDELGPGTREAALLAVFDLFVELPEGDHRAIGSNNTTGILLYSILKINRNHHREMTLWIGCGRIQGQDGKMSKLRDKAVEIVKALRNAGFRGYWVGGCVRDLVMGQEPEDYDVATDARPEQVTKLFPKTIPVGVSFGVVKVLMGDDDFEVATFRSDGRYLDGRHPIEVQFSGEKEDVLRRDFTINGMFFDPMEERLIDYVGGKKDIEAEIVRCIGDPAQRFTEDKLRLIRAVRFAARFGYRIEPATHQALVALAPEVLEVSAERIRDELAKILMGPHPGDGIRLLHQTGLLKVILPEIAVMEGVQQPPEFHPEGDVFTHTLLLLDKIESPSFELAFGALLHDVGKPPTFAIKERIRFDNHCEVGSQMARRIGHRLRFSNQQTEVIAELVRDHLRFKDVRNMRASTLKRFLRNPNFPEHLELHRLDCLASHGDLSNWEFCKKKLAEIGPEEIRPTRLLTGEDLIELGYTPGPQFAKILTAVEDAQLEGRLKTKEAAVEFVKREFPLTSSGSASH
jgi:poly(A) polymerase